MIARTSLLQLLLWPELVRMSLNTFLAEAHER